MQKPLVSVIIPTYNSEKTIRQCLQSIKNQTYKNLEIIVVDRHSKDKTVQIAEQFNVKLLYVTQERSYAKNFAAKSANGDFLLFIDSDMTLASKVIEECVNKCIETKSDAAIIPLKSISKGLLGECRKIERESLSDLTEFMEAARFFRKKPFLTTGGFDESIVCGEDYDLFQKFKKMGYKSVNINSEVFHFEGNPSLYEILSKAYYYGKTLPALIKKSPKQTVERYLRIRFTSVKRTGVAFHKAKLVASYTLVKAFEFMAYIFGMLIQLLYGFSEMHHVKMLKNSLKANKLLMLNFTLLTFIAIAVFRNFFLFDEWPAGGDVLGFISRAYLYGKDFRWLYVWRPISFGFIEGINFMDFFLMVVYWICRSPAWTVKFFLFFSYLAAAFFMYWLAYRFTHHHFASLAASLVYILNQWLFSQLTEAHVDIVFSYSLAPLIFILLDRAFKSGKSKDILFLSLGFSLFITSFHPEFIIIYGVFLAIFTFFFLFFPSKNERFKPRLYRVFKVLTPSFLFAFALSSFFLIPFLANVRAPYLQASYTYFIEDALGTSYANMTDAFTLRGIEKGGYVNIVDIYSGLGLPDFPVNPLLFWLYLLSYSILLIRRDCYTISFALAMLVSVFLAKGTYPPFGEVFVWAWKNIPHFAVFRAANRWIAIAIFSHAFFVSLLVCYLSRFIKKLSARKDEKYFEVKVKNKKFSNVTRVTVSINILNRILNAIRKLLYYASVILLILIFLSGFFSCYFSFSQGLQVYTPPNEYLAVYEWLATRKDDYKAISVCLSNSEWNDPLSEESDFASSGMLTPLGWSHDIGFDSSFIHDKPMLQNGGWDFNVREFLDYLRFRLARGRLTDNLFKMLGTFAYNYIVIPSYVTNHTRQFFLNQEGYNVIYNQSALVLANTYAMPRLYAVNQTMAVVGGFESYDALCKFESFDPRRINLFYLPESIDDEDILSKGIQESQMFCFANSGILDLAMISLGKKAVVIHAGDYGFSSLNTTKYWVKCPSWRIIGAYVLGGDVLTTNGENRIEIPFEINSDGTYNVFIRIGFAPSRGTLKLYVDGEPIRDFYPYFPLMSKIEWVNMSSLNLSKGHHVIVLENDGTGFNDVDAIAIVKPSDLDSQMDKILKMLQTSTGRLLYLFDAENMFLNSSSGNWQWTVIPYDGYVAYSVSHGVNVATLARVNATSECEFMEAPRAIDGDLGTRWTSEKYVLPQWLELTWDAPQSLCGVKITFENAYATDYFIQTWNGTCWVNQTAITRNNELERIHDFPEVAKTNKLRIFVTGFSQFDRVSIWELEVYSPEITSATSKITVPREGKYMLAARVETGPDRGKLFFKINDNIYSVSCNSSVSGFEWREIGPFNLASGDVTISAGNVGVVVLDEILLYSLKDNEDTLPLSMLFHSSTPNVSIAYTIVDSCTYKASINSSEPFTLIFSEAYNPLWKASTSEGEILSYPAFSIVNSFYIGKTGEFNLTIYFEGQKYADVGLQFSFATLIIITFAILVPKSCIERLKARIKIWRKIS